MAIVLGHSRQGVVSLMRCSPSVRVASPCLLTLHIRSLSRGGGMLCSLLCVVRVRAERFGMVKGTNDGGEREMRNGGGCGREG